MATGGEDAVRNYDLVLPTGFRASITPAPLTVTVADAHRRFGRPNPVFTILYMGFVPGEGPEVLSGNLIVVTEAVRSSPPGEYAVVLIGDVTATNYEITLVPGVLTVLPASATHLIPEHLRDAYLAALNDVYSNPPEDIGAGDAGTGTGVELIGSEAGEPEPGEGGTGPTVVFPGCKPGHGSLSSLGGICRQI